MSELVIDGIIGDWWDGTTAKSVREQLATMSGDIAAIISSVGGSVFDGLSIYNQLRRYEGRVSVFVESIAASSASLIAMAGDEIVMASGSQMMIHAPWTVTMGDAAEHKKTIEMLDASYESLIAAYSTRNVDEEWLRAAVDDETWLTAAEAVEHGLADRVDGDISAKSFSIPKGVYRNAPAAMVSQEQDAEVVAAQVWRAHLMGMQAKLT